MNEFQEGFNRYIVECKVAVHPFLYRGREDLIDTLWNVKLQYLVSPMLPSRFNRYIVECKMAYGRKSETLIDQEVNKTQPGSVIIREFEEVGDLTVTSQNAETFQFICNLN